MKYMIKAGASTPALTFKLSIDKNGFSRDIKWAIIVQPTMAQLALLEQSQFVIS